jgi:hypothetical protein
VPAQQLLDIRDVEDPALPTALGEQQLADESAQLASTG